MALGRVGRLVKYGFVAPLLGYVIRRTSLLDGGPDGPPAFINYAGAGDFLAVGDQQAKLITARAPVPPGARVLDLGSGIGRVAQGLHRQRPDLRYDGLDVVRYGIDWSRKAMRDAPGFRFHHADVRNSFYNPFGRTAPEDFRFPFADGSFDLVIATSVFTHLEGRTAKRYLAETSRVLVPGGALYATFFLKREVSVDGARFTFTHRRDGNWTESAAEPEMAVAFDPDWIEDRAAECGLDPTAKWLGAWDGRDGADDLQDAVLLEKKAGP